jgi:hypothetical protein
MPGRIVPHRMTGRTAGRTAARLVAVLAVAFALVAAGRLSAGPGGGPGGTGRDADPAYQRGLRAGLAQGLQEGRALQEGASVPADRRAAVTAAFRDGYAAGADDVFGGYDGGWALGCPYLIVLESGQGPVTYRIASRTPVPPTAPGSTATAGACTG